MQYFKYMYLKYMFLKYTDYFVFEIHSECILYFKYIKYYCQTQNALPVRGLWITWKHAFAMLPITAIFSADLAYKQVFAVHTLM